MRLVVLMLCLALAPVASAAEPCGSASAIMAGRACSGKVAKTKRPKRGYRAGRIPLGYGEWEAIQEAWRDFGMGRPDEQIHFPFSRK